MPFGPERKGAAGLLAGLEHPDKLNLAGLLNVLDGVVCCPNRIVGEFAALELPKLLLLFPTTLDTLPRCAQLLIRVRHMLLQYAKLSGTMYGAQVRCVRG